MYVYVDPPTWKLQDAPFGPKIKIPIATATKCIDACQHKQNTGSVDFFVYMMAPPPMPWPLLSSRVSYLNPDVNKKLSSTCHASCQVGDRIPQCGLIRYIPASFRAQNANCRSSVIDSKLSWRRQLESYVVRFFCKRNGEVLHNAPTGVG